MIVLDASAAVEWLLRTSKGMIVAERLFASNGDPDTAHVPHLLDVEVTHVLRRYVLSGDMRPERGQQAVDYLHGFPMVRYPHTPLLPRIWQLRSNLSAYDAVYVALAESLDAPLITCDARLAAAPGHRARVKGV